MHLKKQSWSWYLLTVAVVSGWTEGEAPLNIQNKSTDMEDTQIHEKTQSSKIHTSNEV